MMRRAIPRPGSWKDPVWQHRKTAMLRGFTLIHAITVMSMMSILMTMTGVVIQVLLRSDHSVSQQAALELTLFNLSRQFRDDVHAATKFGPMKAEDLSSDSLALSGTHSESSRLEYRVAGETLIRESFDGDKFVAREVYRLPECEVQLRMEKRDDKQAEKPVQFLTLDIDRAALSISQQQPAIRVKRKLTVVAELGRDARLSAPPQPKPEGKAGAAESLPEAKP